MGLGLISSSSLFSSSLSLWVCVLLVFTVTIEARPKETKETSAEWSAEWQQVADWWRPQNEKDKWRAFEPSKETSTTRWWEEKLDDNLWDPKAYEATNALEKAPPAAASTESKPASKPEVEGEKSVTNTPTNTETHTEAAAAEVASTTHSQVSNGDQVYHRPAELNTFVERDPESYYRSNGGTFGEKSWGSSYSQLYRSDVPSVPHENPVVVEQKNNGTADKQDAGNVKEEPAKLEADVVEKDEVKENVELSKAPISLGNMPLGSVPVISPSENKTVASEHDTNVAIGDVSKSDVPETQEMPLPGIVEEKKDSFLGRDANAIYGKGESIAMPRVDGVNGVEKEAEAATKKPEEATPPKKTSSDFEDWADWDSSVFDYYDEDEEDDDSKASSSESSSAESGNNSGSTNQSSSSESDADSSDEDDDEDDDDYYDDWYDEWDEDDDDDDDDDEFDDDDEDYYVQNEDQYEVIEKKNGEITISPIKDTKITKADHKKKVSPKTPKKKVKGVDIDTMGMQSDEAEHHADPSHYSKGTIYDWTYPHHKPSVKKDLTNPANKKKFSGLPWISKPTNTLTAENSNTQSSSLKKESSVTHFQPDQLNTESDASTSPNPPPPGLAEESKKEAVTTPPTPSSDEMILAMADLRKNSKDANGFVISFPLEFCKVDYECRAGRACVHGICKCVTEAMCAGHHKPICGSDGVQYSSHCELHRTACINRVHIRVDRRGNCFQKEIEEKEKSWLMEQEKLLQEDKEKEQAKSEHVQLSSEEIYQYPKDVKKDPLTSDVKKAYNSEETKAAAEVDKTASTTTTTTVTISDSKKECTWKEMNEFKEALLMFYCQKFVEPNCKLEVRTDREYLSMLMFSYYDQDYDYYLTATELDDKERDEHFTNNIIINCHLHDFVKYADTVDADGKLTVSEFTNSFEVAAPSPSPHTPVEVITTLASAGNGLELKCGVDAETVIWKRHGSQLSDDKRSHQLMVFDDGALFFSKVGLHHVGNYTCMDADDEANAQVHRLKVQTLPVIDVTPVVQTHLTGADIELKCHAEGIPAPTITWKQGGEVLENSAHATHYYGGGHVVIHNAQYETDSGTYTCSAHNQAGTTEKSVSVTVLAPSAPSYKESSKEAGTFVVFNSKGISAYDPLRCLLRHRIPGDFGNFKFIPDALDGPLTLCRKEESCQWGGAVKVGTEFIYASQPDQSRVVVVDATGSWSPLQVIDTDKRPEKLWYVKHLDQVWVLCESEDDAESTKTIVVIRDASQHIQHRSVHTRPVGNHFDLVQNLFIAPQNDLDHEYDFGYVSHGGQNGLFKLNLEDMSYTKSIDLSNYGCVPTNIAFVPIGGHIVVQCIAAADQHTLQLVMDYLTDTITSTTSLTGKPMASPDSRHLVTVDEFTGKVIVASVSEDGVMETTYEVTVSASISDIAFMPASSHHGYDLVLTSADDDDVIMMNLVTGKVEKISGSQYSDPSGSWHPSPVHRHIVSGDTLSNYLMAPSKSSLAILDAKFKQVECEFLDSVGSDVMVHIPSTTTS